MPHVLVHFDPTQVGQPDIDKLKAALPTIVADALSYAANSLPATYVRPTEIYVRQVAAHPTDQNVSPVEVEVQAGQLRGRDEVHVGALIEAGIRASQTIPAPILDGFKCCQWLRFSEHNNFRFIDPLDHSKKG